MRAWMIPWLFPLALLVLAITFALAPPWVGGLVALVIVVGAGLGWRSYARDEAAGELPNWMRRSRQPR